MSIAGNHFRVRLAAYEEFNPCNPLLSAIHLASDSENDLRYASMSMDNVINAVIGNVDCVG